MNWKRHGKTVYRDNPAARLGWTAVAHCASEAQAEQIVREHAGYPRLVAAIQEDLRGYLGTFPPGHPATVLRDLLRELGEAV